MSSFDSGNDPGDNFDFDEDLEDFFYDDEDGDANEMVSDDLKGLEDFDDKYEVSANGQERDYEGFPFKYSSVPFQALASVAE